MHPRATFQSENRKKSRFPPNSRHCQEISQSVHLSTKGRKERKRIEKQNVVEEKEREQEDDDKIEYMLYYKYYNISKP